MALRIVTLRTSKKTVPCHWFPDQNRRRNSAGRFTNDRHGSFKKQEEYVSSFICCFLPLIFHFVSTNYGPPTSAQGKRLLIDTAFLSFSKTKQSQTTPNKTKTPGEKWHPRRTTGCFVPARLIRGGHERGRGSGRVRAASPAGLAADRGRVGDLFRTRRDKREAVRVAGRGTGARGARCPSRAVFVPWAVVSPCVRPRCLRL